MAVVIQCVALPSAWDSWERLPQTPTALNAGGCRYWKSMDEWIDISTNTQAPFPLFSHAMQIMWYCVAENWISRNADVSWFNDVHCGERKWPFLTILLHNHKQAILHHVSYSSVIGCSPFPAPTVTSYCVSLRAELLFTLLTGCVFILFVVCLCVYVCFCESLPLLVLLQPKHSVLWTQPRGVRPDKSPGKVSACPSGPEPPSERHRRPAGPGSKWSEIFSSRRWNSEVIPAVKSRFRWPSWR